MENTISTQDSFEHYTESAQDDIHLIYTEAKKPLSVERSMLEQIKEILPQIAARAEEAEQLRRVPDENIAL